MSASFVKWTDERVERLKQLHAEGYSATQIAADLGLVTRNAVIGKVHRLGLSKPEKHKGILGFMPIRIKRKKGRGQQPYPRLAVLGHFDPTPKPLPTHRDEDIPAEQRKQLVELRNWHCKFPIGDPGDPGFFFCGGEAYARSFCRHHFGVCYTRTTIQISEAERQRRHFHAIRNIDRKKKGLVA